VELKQKALPTTSSLCNHSISIRIWSSFVTF